MTEGGGEHSVESASSMVESVMQQEAQRSLERASVPVRRPYRTQILLVLVAVLVMAVDAVVILREPSVFTPAEEAAGTRLEIFLAAQVIEAWRDSTQTLPPDLTVLGYDNEDDLVYTREGSSYMLKARVSDQELVYRSGEDLAPFAVGYRIFTR